MFLLEGGCCLAELIGCGTQFVLLAPSLLGRTLARSTRADAALPNEGLRPRTVRLLLHAIEAYQVQISPRRRPCCRYTPTCSHYAAQALRTHGLARGLWLTTRRLVRCRPGARGGSDPVPR
jgi:putative membrane protein insertion efficiency factor